MKNLLALASVGEAATGLLLLIDPVLVVRLLFSADIAGAGLAMSRVAGIALLGLGIACWPRRDGSNTFAFAGMIAYGAAVTLYLVYLGVGGEWVGPLLWPAVVVHATLTVLLVRAWSRERKSSIHGRPT